MISAFFLAICYVLFIIALYAGKLQVFGIDVVWFVSIWFAHFLYFVSLCLIEKHLPFSFLDKIGEKPLRKLCNIFGPVGGAGCEMLVAFCIFVVIAIRCKPIILRSNPAVTPAMAILMLSTLIPVETFFMGIYLYHYLNFRLKIIDDHRNKLRFWNNIIWDEKKSDDDVDERKTNALIQLHRHIEDIKNLPDDVIDASEKSLMSWRVLPVLERQANTATIGPTDKPLDMTKSWDAPKNILAAIPKPRIYFYPKESSVEMLTCVVRIKEIHEWAKTTNRRNRERGMKIYLILVSPENAVPWTCPSDVSWKDLTSGTVKLYDKKPITFITVDGNLWTTDVIPETEEDWKRFLGIDKEVEAAVAKAEKAKKKHKSKIR